MCDKTTRCIQEVEQLFRKVSNDDLDYQTQLAKHVHIQQKIGYLKITNEQLKKSHKKELKAKDKIIQKLKDRERQLLQKLNQLPINQRQFGQNFGKKKLKYSATTFKDQYQREKQKEMAQKQARKKLKAQQKYQQCKGKLQRLEIKYLEAQKQISALRLQNQKLTEQNYHQKLLIQAFLKQKDSQSSGSVADSQSQSYQQQITQMQIMDDQRARRSDLRECKMMDLSQSEGSIVVPSHHHDEQYVCVERKEKKADEQDEILKFIEELETDDQENQGGQDGQSGQRRVDQEEDDECGNYSEYQSQQEHQSPKIHSCSRKSSQNSIPDPKPKQPSVEQPQKPSLQQPRLVKAQPPVPHKPEQQPIQSHPQIQIQNSRPEEQQKLFTVKKERWFGWTIADWKWW